MIIERAMHPRFLSNTYLVAAEEGGAAFFVDAGGPVEGLIDSAQRLGLRPTHVLLTHHHVDHVSEVGTLQDLWGDLEVLIHPLERDLLSDVAATGEIDAGQMLSIGGLEVRPLRTPGHTGGMLSFLVAPEGASEGSSSTAPGGFNGSGAVVFTGDTLFKGSVGGVRAPGHTTYADLRDSIMGTLMELPPDTVICPGHADASTVGEEWERNVFIRMWRGLDHPKPVECIAMGAPATLMLLGPDYDGTHKAWVRWPDGTDDIIAGSQVRQP